MPRIVIAMVAVTLAVHGLIHLTGTAAYMRLADVKGLSYKTTLLSGRWDLGERGILDIGRIEGSRQPRGDVFGLGAPAFSTTPPT